jgi:hypothetical protein
MTVYQYRLATSDDVSKVFDLLVEVAPEIPLHVHIPENKDAALNCVERCCASGETWIALDRDNQIVGFLLAEPDLLQRFHRENQALELPYGGVREGHRGHHIFPDLVATIMAKRFPLTATVKHANKSDMASRLTKRGFTKVGPGLWPNEDIFRWQL